jgi:trimethylamine---corrinoid protein Co-methyltransferase
MGMLDMGMVLSFGQMVIDHEIATHIKRIVSGISMDDDLLGLDVIHKVGIGGNYLAEKHTVKYMKTELQQEIVMERRNRDRWEKDGKKELAEVAREHAAEILKNHQPKPLEDGVHEEFQRIIKSAE